MSGLVARDGLWSSDMASSPPAIPALQPKHDAIRVGHDLRDQLASSRRRTGFFLGAGVSMSANLPGLDALTKIVENSLKDPQLSLYRAISGQLGANANLEQVLNKLRTIRELLEGSTGPDYLGLTYEAAVKLDQTICQTIYDNVSKPDVDKLHGHRSLATWLRYIRRDAALEVFTTNYDLLLEIAFEGVGTSFFDGFVGAVSPFFVPECIDADSGKNAEDVYPPRAWIRLWKLHGSVNWQLIAGPAPAPDRICRATGASSPSGDTQLLIYPSREKYVQSQRLPFVVYMDRLRRFLQSGESLLLVIGYSFRDEHINEVVSQGLRSNTRLAVAVLLYEKPSPYLLSLAQMHKNLSVLAPNQACIGGIHGSWLPVSKKQPGEERPFWNDTTNSFALGDFSKFAEFLNLMTGYQDVSQSVAVPSSGSTGVSKP